MFHARFKDFKDLNKRIRSPQNWSSAEFRIQNPAKLRVQSDAFAKNNNDFESEYAASDAKTCFSNY